MSTSFYELIKYMQICRLNKSDMHTCVYSRLLVNIYALLIYAYYLPGITSHNNIIYQKYCNTNNIMSINSLKSA